MGQFSVAILTAAGSILSGNQHNVYLTLSGQKSLEKPHPFGGIFKRNLRQWATGGCE